MVDFITRHPNIGGGVSFHTHSGVILRPFSSEPRRATCPPRTCGSTSSSARSPPSSRATRTSRSSTTSSTTRSRCITGGFDWIYEHLGQFFWTVEIWAPVKEAGVESYHFIDWYREHPPEDDLKLLAWSDRELAGEGYIAWYPFDHPQLGRVELGGWNKLVGLPQPAEEIRRARGEALPRLARRGRRSPAEARDPEDGGGGPRRRYVARARSPSTTRGTCRSYVTKRALERKIMRGVSTRSRCRRARRSSPGRPRVEGGQLEGRASKPTLQAFLPNLDVTGDRGQCEWTVRAPARDDPFELSARHDRAGRAATTLTLG